jgi:CheY-like chemotaxis protein
LVDDDAHVLTALSRQLGRDHFVTGFTEAQLALEAVRQGGTFDVMLCDLMMPSMNGMEFFGKLETLSPALATRVVFVTGGAFTPEAGRFVAERRHLDKPVEMSKLRSLVREMTAGARR